MRHYIKRRALTGFRVGAGASGEAASAALAAAYADLEVARRQALIYGMYARPYKSILVRAGWENESGRGLVHQQACSVPAPQQLHLNLHPLGRPLPLNLTRPLAGRAHTQQAPPPPLTLVGGMLCAKRWQLHCNAPR